MDKIQAMLELERRGKLPEQFVPLLAEARSRGLVPGGAEPAPADPVNPDGTYGQPPEGMVTNPQTGQMTERALLSNHMQQNGVSMPESAVIGAAQGATFGGADEGVGALYSIMPGEGSIPDRYAFGREYARAMQESSREENPWTHGVSEIAGAMSVPLGALDRTAKGASLLKRGAQSTAVGAGLGGTYGFLSGEGGPSERLDALKTGAKWGAAGGAVAPLVGAGVQKYANNRAGRRAIRQGAKNAPSTQELRAAGQAAYRQIDDAGVQIKPESFRSARNKVEDALLGNTGYDPLPGPGGLTPKAARVVQTMDESLAGMSKDPTAALPFKSLDQVRRRASAPMLSPEKVEQGAGQEIISQLDDYVRNLTADDVVAGDVETLKSVLPKARNLWARMSRSQLIDDAAGLGEEAYLSGGGTGIKYQFKRILKNPKLSRGFSEAERKAMARVVNGTVPEQVLRLAGSGLSQIGGTIAAGIGGGPIAALGVLGATNAARSASDKIIQKNAEVVRALVANGGLKALPKAPDSVRKITEQLLRRAAAAGPQ